MDPRALTLKFNEHINNRDLDGLGTLMTDDHAFIDTANKAHSRQVAVPRRVAWFL